ncbi:hypothetical protein SAMN04488540_12920 [Ferrimonas sediminum]|uniref:Uncharacterized protein n=1 Tax=Ferrimonas sediminum TaxID=718193 RepID=A0A1G9BFI0_9GAMM|nr:hypothetical protein [Ferrimonas sediminum]SDK38288.1 hypothetical protein SAMN04488540_12920 [Ferrimonas sediminum]
MAKLRRKPNAHPIARVLSGVTLFLILLFFFNSARMIHADGVWQQFSDSVSATLTTGEPAQ